MKKRNLFSFLRKYDELSFLLLFTLVRVNGEPWGAAERERLFQMFTKAHRWWRGEERRGIQHTHPDLLTSYLSIFPLSQSPLLFWSLFSLNVSWKKKKNIHRCEFYDSLPLFFNLLLIFYADFGRQSTMSSKVTDLQRSYRLIRCQWSGLLLPLHWWGHFCSSWLSSILNMLE